jgi:peptidoglycan/LPS O-acetylase OafA/YrhL
MDRKISSIQSKNLNIIKGIAILMVIMIHCDFRGRLQQDYSVPFDIYMQCLTREIVFDAVPLFFFVSGFLFYLNDESIWQKWKKRIKSLLIPYLLWCSFYLAFLFITQRVLGMERFFSGDKLKLIAHFEAIDYLRVFWDIRDGGPILAPLWFLRNLIVLCVLAPIFKLGAQKLKIVFPLLLFVNYLFVHWNFLVVTDNNILFFGFGIYLCNTTVKLKFLDKVKFKYVAPIWLLLLISVMVTYTNNNMVYNTLHRLFMIIDCMLVYSAVDVISRKFDCMLLLKITSASFFIYLAHEPWISYIQSFFFKYVSLPEAILVIMPWIFVFIAFCYTYVGHYLLSKYTPSIYRILTGSR